MHTSEVDYFPFANCEFFFFFFKGWSYGHIILLQNLAQC